MPVRAVIVADVRDASSVTRLKLEFDEGLGTEPMYRLQFAARGERRHHDPIEGMGAFADLRQLAMFEVAR
jgi:hypothetical protein